ncbi:MAG: hypothetical protein ACK5WD_06860 [bacterium]
MEFRKVSLRIGGRMEQRMKQHRRAPFLIALFVIDMIALLHMALEASVGVASFRAVSSQLLAEADGDAMRAFLEGHSSQSARFQLIFICVLLLNIVALAIVVDSDRRHAAGNRRAEPGTEGS